MSAMEYSDYARDRTGWFFGMSGPQLALVLVAALPGLVAMNSSAWLVLVVWLPVWALLVVLAVVPVRGRSATGWAIALVLHAVGAVMGWSTWQSKAAAGVAADLGEADLPGILAGIAIHDGPPVGHTMVRVALVQNHCARTWAVVARMVHPGIGLAEPGTRNRMGGGLAELQEIGREAGLSPEAVESAARSLELRPQAGVRRYLRMPIQVERSIDLPRKLTEAEWERLVVQLRETFNARGTVSSNGSFRQWTNGNLQALLEPTATGHRLRLSTMRASSVFQMNIGVGMIGMGALMAIGGGIAGHLGDMWSAAAMFTTMGVGSIAVGGLQLPSWARRRASQMEAITSRLALETGAKSADDGAN